MSDEFPYGGSAYPFVSHGGVHEHQACHSGMSLRDYFAAKTLNGLIASDENEKLPDGQTLQGFWQQRAEFAYFIADAMLAAREAKP